MKLIFKDGYISLNPWDVSGDIHERINERYRIITAINWLRRFR